MGGAEGRGMEPQKKTPRPGPFPGQDGEFGRGPAFVGAPDAP